VERVYTQHTLKTLTKGLKKVFFRRTQLLPVLPIITFLPNTSSTGKNPSLSHEIYRINNLKISTHELTRHTNSAELSF